ncbi:MAG: ROK family protein [Clostridiales Family XIII bacterium]|jgi:predicted NBD/HSP70 family sugar kinase/predicted DNA-binding transcriptional regulator|nr:ROK family protein [Clostridiales Family XIII bacterium]
MAVISDRTLQEHTKTKPIGIKRQNYRDVYNFLYNRGFASKQEIANALNMSLPTVTTHLTKLIKKGFVRQGDTMPSYIGRRAIAYEIVKNAYLSIGVEIIKKHAYISAIDLKGDAIARQTVDIRYKNEDSYYKEVSATINDFIMKEGFEISKILGIAFTLQGIASLDRKSISWGLILGNTGLNVEAFQQYLEPHCYLLHDARCAAIAESWERKNLKNAIYLSVSPHLGSSVIFDGKAHRGDHSMGGVIEHAIIHPDGLTCYCGKKGCADPYCSLNSLVGEDETNAEFFEKKANGNADAKTRWDAFLKNLALLIHNSNMLLDVEIILGGHVAKYLTGEDLERLADNIKEITAFPDNLPVISIARYQYNAISTGAALIIIDEFLENF